MSQVQYQEPVLDTSSDDIRQLPSDKLPPSHAELQIVDTLFKEQQSTFNKIFTSAKDVILMGILFIVLSIPQIDPLILKIIPSAETSPYILILIKAIAFMVIFYLIKNLYLARKK